MTAADAAAAPAPAAHLGGGQALHEGSEVAVVDGPKQEVPMVGKIVEDFAAVVAAVQGVKTMPPRAMRAAPGIPTNLRAADQ